MAFEQPSWLPQERAAGAVEIEKSVLEFWKTNAIFQKSLDASAGRPTYVFYEGPPTANGKPHPGHVLTRVMKDIFPRYRTMTGHSVPRKAGWDTHGLPVEIEVEKELGLESKEDIEKYGVEPFVRKCMDSVFKYTREWEELTDRIGFWVDLPEAYVTYKREYVESVWWALSKLWEQKLLYQGHKIVPWCTRCGTGLSSHEVGWGYKTVQDPSIVVKFKALGKDDTYILAWTTTPWTLLSNVALAVKPDAEYVALHHEKETRGETWYIARDRMVGALGDDAPQYVTETLKGQDLVGLKYEPLFRAPDDMLYGKEAWRVVGDDFVTLEDGTGVVHIAPAFGADDQSVGQKNDLPTVIRTDDRGRMTADTPFAGTYCKDADKDILRDLKERELLLKNERMEHEYPHCWRCDTPLLYYPRAGWFIKTTQFREKMLELNRTITWFPEHIQEGRFGNFLRDNIDWALSRERYWGTPLPVWKCERCSYTEAVSSLKEVYEKPGVEGADAFENAKQKEPELNEHLEIHKPYIDAVMYACPRCSGIMKRTPEVIDCWFDSGSMPFAQWGYPAVEGSDEMVKAALPADFISEAIDQTRGWFYSMLAISTMLPEGLGFGVAPYKNCVVLGLVCDDKGFKMSKSKGNYVEPKQILDAQGADAMRWYFLSANQPWTSVRFSDRNVAMANKDFLIKLRNVYSFFRIYAKIDAFDPASGGEGATSARPSTWGAREGRRDVSERAPLDRWILGELARTIQAARTNIEAYNPMRAAQALSEFVESLSNWYLRRSRPRFWARGMEADKLDAYWTLYEALTTTALLVAPFTPFAAEEFYQVLVRTPWPETAPESVHLCEYPQPDEFATDETLSRSMALAREAAALGRAARADAKVKVRMPLSEAIVVAPDATDAKLMAGLTDIVSDELNVKTVAVAQKDPEQVKFQVKPNFRALGPTFGKKVKDLAKLLAKADGAGLRAQLAADGAVTVCEDASSGELYLPTADRPAGESPTHALSGDDLDIRASAQKGYAAASGLKLVVLLNTEITDNLRREGIARDFVSGVQNERKKRDLPYDGRITTYVVAPPQVVEAIRANEEYVKRETLADSIVFVETMEAAETATSFKIDDAEVTIRLDLAQ